VADAADIARRIDHTALKAETPGDRIDALCAEAKTHGFAAVCVNPVFVPRACGALAGSDAAVCTVIGFPLGANAVSIKAAEARECVQRGADEIDIVAHLPNLLACRVDKASAELRTIIEAARAERGDVIAKVIVESAALMADVDGAEAERRIAAACEAVAGSGADFIKTSTGFHAAGGATLEAVRLMARHGGALKIKAAGGIRDADDAHAYLAAGAERLGCSAGVAIVTGARAAAGY